MDYRHETILSLRERLDNKAATFTINFGAEVAQKKTIFYQCYCNKYTKIRPFFVAVFTKLLDERKKVFKNLQKCDTIRIC